MTTTELLNNLKEFYLECSNRGWCKVDKLEGKDFLTIYSSDTNFTHLPLNFGRFPNRCIISPKLSSRNIKKIDKILSAFDSTLLINIVPMRNVFKIYISNIHGKTVLRENIRLYTLRRSPKPSF